MSRITYIPNRVIDADGVADGAAIYVYQAGGSTTPVPLFSDDSYTTPVSNPYVVNAGAIAPVLFTDYEDSIRVRIVSVKGTVLLDEDPYVGVSDAQLRENLASSDPGKGADLVGVEGGGTAQDNFDRVPWLAKLQQSGAKNDHDFTPGNPGTDDRAALQSIIDWAEANRQPTIHLPAWDRNFLLGGTLEFTEPDTLVVGDKSATYNRAREDLGKYNKRGSFVLAAGANIGFRFGNINGPPINEANTIINGSWTVRDIAVRRATDAADKTQIAFQFNRQTNGPDRPFRMEGCSAQRMAAGFHIPPAPPGVSIALANLSMVNVNFSNNKHGVLIEGPVYCMDIRSSQIEQNNDGTPTTPGHYQVGGGIRGKVSGSVTIHDNMLEGQPNAVDLFPDAGSLQISAARNYIEKNDVNNSRFVWRFGTAETFHVNSLYLGENFKSNVNLPPDYLILHRRGSWQVDIRDRYAPVTFENFSGVITRGSNLLAPGIRHFRLASLNMAAKAPEIYLGDDYSAPDVSGGGVTGISGLSGGSGYADGETVDLIDNDGYGYGATAVATVSGGAITSLASFTPGYLYRANAPLKIRGRTSGAESATATATVTAYQWSQQVFSEGIRMNSPMGLVRARDATVHTPLGFGCSAGDLIVINAYVNVLEYSGPPAGTSGASTGQLTTGAGAFVQGLGPTQAPTIAPGQWAFVCIPLIAPSTQASLGFKFTPPSSGTLKAVIAGLTARNYGQFANDGSNRADIYPVLPRL